MAISIRHLLLTFCLIFFTDFFVDIHAQESRDLAVGQPQAVIDLRTQAGVDLVKAEWKYQEATIVEDHSSQTSSIKTYRLEPQAGSKDYNDSSWKILAATDVTNSIGTGFLSFAWYRLQVTLPEKVAEFDTKDSTAVFEVVLDNYAEIWVDGKLTSISGQSGGSVIKGFHARNRVILSDNVQPGQTIQLAILGINGPLSNLNKNGIRIGSATIDFYKTFPITSDDWHDVGKVVRIDSALDELIDRDATVEKVATGFQFTEGPVWHPDNYLLFSDTQANVIYRYDPQTNNISIYLTKSGYSGFNIGEYKEPGSNGLTLDSERRLVICQEGHRRIIRYIPAQEVVLADRYQGKRLNSPNDLVYRSDGILFFTDPPYGFPRIAEDPRKELLFAGVYCLMNGELKLVSKELDRPNGLAFSPNEKYLYVTNLNTRNNSRTVMRYEIKPDGTVANSKVFFNVDQADPDNDVAIDGLKVDQQGNLYITGGIWVVSPEGKYLGKITCPEPPANLAWGGQDRKTLYITARKSLYRVRTKVPGFLPYLFE